MQVARDVSSGPRSSVAPPAALPDAKIAPRCQARCIGNKLSMSLLDAPQCSAMPMCPLIFSDFDLERHFFHLSARCASGACCPSPACPSPARGTSCTAALHSQADKVVRRTALSHEVRLANKSHFLKQARSHARSGAGCKRVSASGMRPPASLMHARGL